MFTPFTIQVWGQTLKSRELQGYWFKSSCNQPHKGSCGTGCHGMVMGLVGIPGTKWQGYRSVLWVFKKAKAYLGASEKPSKQVKVGTKHASKQVKVVAKWNALLLGKFRMSRLSIGNGCGGLRFIATHHQMQTLHCLGGGADNSHAPPNHTTHQ